MSKERMKLGILFNFQSTWMGGIIYIINFVNAINFLDDEDKPEIIVFYSKSLEKYINEFNYPYITFVESEFPSIIKGFVQSWLKRRNIFIDSLISEYSLDTIYPVRNFPVKNRTKANVVAWYADLQHKYYPEFFTRITLIHRTIRLHYMLRNADKLVVSSQAVKDDFFKFYPPKKNLKFHIYHFVSINKDFDDITIEDLRSKYGLPEKYFMISNQFHKHKNHKVLLLALAKLKSMGIRFHFAMTGKFPEAKDSPYIAELHSIIEKYDLKGELSFLGLIPRKDQMQLMNHCQAVIQPSLFEGWSTVIEDAISIQVPVIASNLDVNIEQLQDKGTYFEPHNTDQLVEILKNYHERNMDSNIYDEYSKRIQEAVKNVLSFFKE